MNNEEKIEKIENVKKDLAKTLIEKSNKITDTSNLYKKGSHPHRASGWKDSTGDKADVTYDGLEYKYKDYLYKYFSIDDLLDMINMADKLLNCIDNNINEEYGKALD